MGDAIDRICDIVRMRPHFSILGLLVATAYIALAIGGLRSPLSLWGSMALYGWLALMFALSVSAAGVPSRRSAFARAALAASIAYVAASHFQRSPDYPERGVVFELPHRLIYMIEFDDRPPFRQFPFKVRIAEGQYDVSIYRERVAAAHGSLLFGLLAGGIAAWRFDRKPNQLRVQVN
jgi:hypothetical protein